MVNFCKSPNRKLVTIQFSSGAFQIFEFLTRQNTKNYSLFHISASCPVASNRNGPHGHDKYNHHVIVQHGLVRCVHRALHRAAETLRGQVPAMKNFQNPPQQSFSYLVFTKQPQNQALLEILENNLLATFISSTKLHSDFILRMTNNLLRELQVFFPKHNNAIFMSITLYIFKAFKMDFK